MADVSAIQVGIRVRPLIKHEIEQGEEIVWNTTKCGTIKHDNHAYQFDHVWNFNRETGGCAEEASQTKVYTDFCSKVVDNAYGGFNGCLFVYGQTGSGKSFTMFGGDGEKNGVSGNGARKKSASSRDASRNDSRANSKSARLESVAARLQNWKELVIPELLERVTKYNIKKQYAAGADQLRMAKEEAAAATRVAAAAEAEESGAPRRKGRKRGSLSLRAAAARGDWDGTGYEPTLRDLFRFVRNVHEHPGLQAERFAMIRALGAAGAHLPKFPEGEDRWGAARRVVEAYVVHVFPELPLLAQALLTKEGREAAQKVGGARLR